MSRSEFGKKLRSHDWYYGYSDDYSVWRRGQTSESNLRSAHAQLECPFDMATLRKWAHNMILEEFAEEEPGNWYRQPRMYKCVAPTTREDLLLRAEHDEITHWLSLGATVEDISELV